MHMFIHLIFMSSFDQLMKFTFSGELFETAVLFVVRSLVQFVYQKSYVDCTTYSNNKSIDGEKIELKQSDQELNSVEVN